MDVLEGDLYFDVESGAAPFAEDREPAEAPA